MKQTALFVLALCACCLWGTAGDAAIKKYQMFTIDILNSANASPPADKVNADIPPEAPFDVTFVDDNGPSPILKKFVFKIVYSSTVLVPGLAGPGSFIFLKNNYHEGPGPVRKPRVFTGTGSTAAGSTVSWGVVTGWTVTGAQYCNASPPVICEFASQSDETTGEPLFQSDFYDLGTWTFHATGFTATPFVHQYFSTSFGNNMRWSRGFAVVDFGVPALPLVGVVLLGGSLVLGGLAALRRGRRE